MRAREQKKKRAQKLLKKLKQLFPNPKITLRYGNTWELLVAVMLSAQCTDKKVNEVTAKLFRKYKKLDDYARASSNRRTKEEFEQDVRSTGFYRNKTKNILKSAKIIQERYGGHVPDTMDEILKLPGVARKTANVVLGNAYGVVEGIAVDTHVARLSQRFGLTKETSPEKIEQDLMEIMPKDEWFKFTYRLIEYGRKYCSAKRCPPSHPLRVFDI